MIRRLVLALPFVALLSTPAAAQMDMSILQGLMGVAGQGGGLIGTPGIGLGTSNQKNDGSAAALGIAAQLLPKLLNQGGQGGGMGGGVPMGGGMPFLGPQGGAAPSFGPSNAAAPQIFMGPVPGQAAPVQAQGQPRLVPMGPGIFDAYDASGKYLGRLQVQQ